MNYRKELRIFVRTNTRSYQVMKIIVGTDFSEASENASTYAFQLAAQLSAELVFFHAYPTALEKDKYLPEEIKLAIKEEGDFASAQYFHKYLKHLRATLDEVVAVHPVIRPGKPDVALLALARQEKADLLILGSRDIKKMALKMMGTTTATILKKASCPVLIIPPDVSWKPIQHVVYGTRFDEKEQRVPMLLDRLADLSGAHISCLTVRMTDLERRKAKQPVLGRIQRLQEDPSNRIFFYSLRHKGVVVGLLDFTRMYKGDLVAVLSNRKRGYRNPFSFPLVKSLLDQLAVPLLVLFD